MQQASTLTTLNHIQVVNRSALNPANYTVWVAGFMANAQTSGDFYILQADGTFLSEVAPTTAAFIAVDTGLTVNVPNVTNSGNNRLVFAITPAGTTPAGYPLNGYTAYPFNNAPGVCPPGPYDIFEFGPNAQYDVSAVDSFGLNLSFIVEGDTSTYGAMPWASRTTIGTVFQSFTSSDPNGAAFTQLLYTSPSGTGYPAQIDGQFTAIIAPKDWLAIYPNASGLSGYWTDTVNAFFANGNQLSLFLNAATVGTYTGSSDGTQYVLTGPGKLQVTIPMSDFTGNQPFIQAVRGPNSGESPDAYAAFNQIEAAVFEAFSRGVALDGVGPKGVPISATYTSDAWTNTKLWFTNHRSAYNDNASLYDVYAKFFHYATVPNVSNGTIFGANTSGSFGMAYGFSLDENPNVGSTLLQIPPNAWPASMNIPAKPLENIGSQTVTLTIGPWPDIA